MRFAEGSGEKPKQPDPPREMTEQEDGQKKEKSEQQKKPAEQVNEKKQKADAESSREKEKTIKTQQNLRQFHENQNASLRNRTNQAPITTTRQLAESTGDTYEKQSPVFKNATIRAYKNLKEHMSRLAKSPQNKIRLTSNQQPRLDSESQKKFNEMLVCVRDEIDFIKRRSSEWQNIKLSEVEGATKEGTEKRLMELEDMLKINPTKMQERVSYRENEKQYAEAMDEKYGDALKEYLSFREQDYAIDPDYRREMIDFVKLYALPNLLSTQQKRKELNRPHSLDMDKTLRDSLAASIQVEKLRLEKNSWKGGSIIFENRLQFLKKNDGPPGNNTVIEFPLNHSQELTEYGKLMSKVMKNAVDRIEPTLQRQPAKTALKEEEVSATAKEICRVTVQALSEMKEVKGNPNFVEYFIKHMVQLRLRQVKRTGADSFTLLDDDGAIHRYEMRPDGSIHRLKDLVVNPVKWGPGEDHLLKLYNEYRAANNPEPPVLPVRGKKNNDYIPQFSSKKRKKGSYDRDLRILRSEDNEIQDDLQIVKNSIRDRRYETLRKGVIFFNALLEFEKEKNGLNTGLSYERNKLMHDFAIQFIDNPYYAKMNREMRKDRKDRKPIDVPGEDYKNKPEEYGPIGHKMEVSTQPPLPQNRRVAARIIDAKTGLPWKETPKDKPSDGPADAQSPANAEPIKPAEKKPPTADEVKERRKQMMESQRNILRSTGFSALSGDRDDPTAEYAISNMRIRFEPILSRWQIKTARDGNEWYSPDFYSERNKDAKSQGVAKRLKEYNVLLANEAKKAA